MVSTKRDIGAEILEGIREIKRGEHGRVVTVPSVASIREATGLSQSRFSQLLGVSVRTLQEWEQGRRAPSGAARTLLMMTAKNPRKVKALWLDLAQNDVRIVSESTKEREDSDTFVVRVPRALHRQLQVRAKKEAVSLDHLIVRILAARTAVTQRPPEKDPSLVQTAQRTTKSRISRA